MGDTRETMGTLIRNLDAEIPFLRNVLFALVFFVGGWLASKWVYRLMVRALTTRHIDQALGRFLATTTRYVVLAAAILAAMDSVGLHTTSLVAVLASAGLAVGLALQGSLTNFASGVMLLFFRPFHIGDKVTIKEKVGVVDDIGVFNTVLVSPDNEKMIIPNSIVTGGIIVNSSDRGTLRGTLPVLVRAGAADVGRIVELLRAAAGRAERVAKEPEPEVLLVDMEAGALDFGLSVWYKASDEEHVMHALRCAVLEALAAAGLELGERPKLILRKSKGAEHEGEPAHEGSGSSEHGGGD